MAKGVVRPNADLATMRTAATHGRRPAACHSDHFLHLAKSLDIKGPLQIDKTSLSLRSGVVCFFQETCGRRSPDRLDRCNFYDAQIATFKQSVMWPTTLRRTALIRFLAEPTPSDGKTRRLRKLFLSLQARDGRDDAPTRPCSRRAPRGALILPPVMKNANTSLGVVSTVRSASMIGRSCGMPPFA